MPNYNVQGYINMDVDADTPDEAEQEVMADVLDAWQACGFKLTVTENKS